MLTVVRLKELFKYVSVALVVIDFAVDLHHITMYVQANVWVHVVASYNETHVVFYANGTQVGVVYVKFFLQFGFIVPDPSVQRYPGEHCAHFLPFDLWEIC
jgi:hypothetical protein